MALFEHDVRSSGWSPRRSQDVSGRGRVRESRFSGEESRTATSRSRSPRRRSCCGSAARTRRCSASTATTSTRRRRSRRTSASAPRSCASSSPRATSSRGSCPATPVPAEELRQPARLRDFAQTLRRVHDGPPIVARFDSFRVVENYCATAIAHGVAVPTSVRGGEARRERGSSAPAAALRSRTCHNDLLNANLIATEDGLVIVDWEYAGMGDRFFDLANFAANHELTDAESSELAPRLLRRVATRRRALAAVDALHVGLPRGDVGRRAAGDLGARRRLRRRTRTSTSSGSPARRRRRRSRQLLRR